MLGRSSGYILPQSLSFPCPSPGLTVTLNLVFSLNSIWKFHEHPVCEPTFLHAFKRYFIDTILYVFFLLQTNKAISPPVPFSSWDFCKSLIYCFPRNITASLKSKDFLSRVIGASYLQIPTCQWSHCFLSALILKLLGFWIVPNLMVIKWFGVLIYLSLLCIYIGHLF